MKVKTIEGSSIDYLDHPRPVTVEVDPNANARRYNRRSVEDEVRLQSNEQVLWTFLVSMHRPAIPFPSLPLCAVPPEVRGVD